MSTAVETAFVPHKLWAPHLVNYPIRTEVLPIYGCKGNPECLCYCWLKGKSGERLRRMMHKNSGCVCCLTMEPHIHMHRLIKIKGNKRPTVFSAHMVELADLMPSTIDFLQHIIRHSPQHLFQIFTHQPDFWNRYPKWPKNVWCCQSITSGDIGFPPDLECGVRVAYCEPVMGQLEFVATEAPRFLRSPDWLVIGLLNHATYAKFGITLEMLAGWIKDLMTDARALGIPIFMKSHMKSHKLWAQLGIEVVQEWPR